MVHDKKWPITAAVAAVAGAVVLAVVLFKIASSNGLYFSGTKTTFHDDGGVVVRVYRPRGMSGHSRSRTENWETHYYEYWGYGRIGKGRGTIKGSVAFDLIGMRLHVNGGDYGPVSKGDSVDIWHGEVYVNGVRRSAVAPARSAET